MTTTARTFSNATKFLFALTGFIDNEMQDKTSQEMADRLREICKIMPPVKQIPYRNLVPPNERLTP